MPEEFLYVLRVDVPLEEEGGARVAQVVEGDLRQAGALQERREGPLAEVGGVDQGSALRGEDEALIPVETGPRRCPTRRLPVRDRHQ